MKLFTRGNETTKAAPAGPAAATAPAPAPGLTAAPAAAPAPAGPDITAILDANVKEMSDKIAKLTNSLEGAQTEKAGFEAKLEAMEDRMRKLSSLTEMISAQYNPFVGEAPSERDPLPSPDVGLAAPTLGAAHGALAPLLEPPVAGGDAGLPPYVGAPVLAELPAPGVGAYASPGADAAVAGEGAQVWSVQPSFESSLLMLGWADMLLKNVPTRESLVELVDYYHNIGWIGDPARDLLLAYANGISVAASAEPHADWRASVEVHEKSLLFIEKLKASSGRRG